MRRDVHPMEEAQGSLVVLHPDNRVVELSFVSSIPFILCRGRSLSEPVVPRKRANALCGFIPLRAG
jgi:hypothetical protein